MQQLDRADVLYKLPCNFLFDVFRSSDVFKRDDEKEVERKARARKARETRRSTQVRKQ